MKQVASVVGFSLVLGFLHFISNLIWGNSGRFFLLSVLIALSFGLSLILARAVQNLNKDLAQMGELDRRALQAKYPEEVEELTELIEEVQEHHWFWEGLRQFVLEVLEISGLLVAFLALPVIVTLVRDDGFSLNDNITIWQLALGFLGAAIYVWLRYYWRRLHYRRADTPEPSDEAATRS